MLKKNKPQPPVLGRCAVFFIKIL